MKPRKKFKYLATIALILALISWTLTQKYLVGPLQEAIFRSGLNLILHAIALWYVLKYLAWRFLKK
jgi:hypothetical protein